MCFYEQYKLACGDYKWGNFKQHCSKEYRTGETCGMKMIMNTTQKSDICKNCTKIETKRRRIAAEQERINRWYKEQQRGQNRKASIEAAETQILRLEGEVYQLECSLYNSRKSLH